jgi:hypothetical protein
MHDLFDLLLGVLLKPLPLFLPHLYLCKYLILLLLGHDGQLLLCLLLPGNPLCFVLLLLFIKLLVLLHFLFFTVPFVLVKFFNKHPRFFLLFFLFFKRVLLREVGHQNNILEWLSNDAKFTLKLLELDGVVDGLLNKVKIIGYLRKLVVVVTLRYHIVLQHEP